MKITNQAVCDLRLYNSTKAMEKISKIKNVALLLVPKDMDDETRAAYAAIEKANVATEIEVDASHSPLIFNGETTITDDVLPDGESPIIINGTARLFRLSPGKTVKVIANGDLLYDIRSESQIQLVNVNGECDGVNFDKLVEIPMGGILTENLLRPDPETIYYGNVFLMIPHLPVQVQGTAKSPILLADSSIRNTNLVLDAQQVIYRDNITNDVTLKFNLDKLRISADFLQQISGKLVCFNIRHVIIEKSVTPELLREKVLLMYNIHHIKATRKTFDAAQLLAENVQIISK